MPTRAEWLCRVDELAPLIRTEADAGERARRLTPALMDALHDARFFRMLLPRRLDGGEVDPLTFVEVLEAVARIDASAAWCLGQAGGCAMVGAYLRPDVAADVFGDPRAVLAWGPGPARAVAVDGGYRVTGAWSFASGVRHATWLGGHSPIHEPDGTPRLRADGRPEIRTMLFPAASATVTDVWSVLGLRATGSDSFAVADLFVPHERSVSRDNPAERRESGPLYCFSSGNLYASGFAGVALGIARSMLEEFVALARDKTPRGFTGTLRESPVVQSQVALAEARLASARRFLLGSLEDIWRAVGRAGTLALEQRVQIRLASTFAIHQARDVVDTIYHAAGASAIFENGGFERRFRDLHAATQQLQGRDSHFEAVGQFLLGLPPDTTWM
jgi:alkylation response protein AidB-like acyl-CoA dehydrogenase